MRIHGAPANRSRHSVFWPTFNFLKQVISWTVLVKAGLVTGAALGAASQYLVNG